jgi:uncharacterized repeat protein (TIGR03803 family)
MKTSAAAITLTALFLVACGSSQNGVPSMTSGGSNLYRSVDLSTLGVHDPLSPSVLINTIHVFSGPPDGAFPFAGLVNVNDVLYGTTLEGGTACGNGGCGTIFAVTSNGLERVEYRFQGGSDGYWPESDLVNVNGTLYGTTLGGGGGSRYGCPGGCGTIFAITSSGTKVWTYSFQGLSDGASPYAGLVYVNGTLYGTTSEGGSTTCGGVGCGTFFAVTLSGQERGITIFRGYDGAFPTARLINVNGTLYGTTFQGGAYSSHCSNGCGTVYSITTSGSKKVLHSFAGGTDGAHPYAGLANVNGTLYGTTTRPGGSGCGGSGGCGTIFAVTPPSGNETVIHAFAGGSDGALPIGGLINVSGTLYGTTELDGAYGAGTVFSVTLPSGTEKVIHAFQGGDDGSAPRGRLLNVKRTLYGTTDNGGVNVHVGTVFSLKLGLGLTPRSR